MAERKYSRNQSIGKKNDKKLPYLVLGFFTVGFLSLLFLAFFSLVASGPLMGECVAVVEINGEITTQTISPSIFSEGVYGSYEISRKIYELDDDDNIAAVLFVINSPGGSVVGSDEIYRAVDSLDKPTVSYFREVAASGGYYIATPTDYIISEPNALTGSIGTVIYLAEFSELADSIGIKDNIIKSGEMKDIGNPMRNMSEAEHALLQEVILEAFDDFKSKIVDNRGDKLNYPLYNQALDGRVLSGKMAYEAGLVDGLGSRDDALMKAADFAGLEYETVSDINICTVRTAPEPAGLFDMHSLLDGLFAQDSVPTLQYR